jgi:hypothetical protein
MSGGRKSKKKRVSTRARLISTFLALVALGVVLRFLPARTHNGTSTAQASMKQTPEVAPADLQVSSVQMSEAVGGEALYLDGRVSNESKAGVKQAIAEVTFLDVQGRPVAQVQQPLAGLPKGGVGAVRGEFSQNPIGPNETRFFRVAVEQVPASWNHEVPELKIVAVKGK